MGKEVGKIVTCVPPSLSKHVSRVLRACNGWLGEADQVRNRRDRLATVLTSRVARTLPHTPMSTKSVLNALNDDTMQRRIAEVISTPKWQSTYLSYMRCHFPLSDTWSFVDTVNAVLQRTMPHIIKFRNEHPNEQIEYLDLDDALNVTHLEATCLHLIDGSLEDAIDYWESINREPLRCE